MKKRKYSQPITFFVEPCVYEKIREITDRLEIGMSEFIRESIENYFKATHDEVDEAKDDERLSAVQ